MWKLHIFQKGLWKGFSEHKSGNAAKVMARKVARVDTFTGSSIEKYRILDPVGIPWMTGSKKECHGWFKIVWA